MVYFLKTTYLLSGYFETDMYRKLKIDLCTITILSPDSTYYYSSICKKVK